MVWKKNWAITEKIENMTEKLGDNVNFVTTSYFEYFKKIMKQRSRIQVSLVEKHWNDVCFIVDTNFTHVQEALPRVRWLRPFPYEVNIDETSTTTIALLAEDKDYNSQEEEKEEEGQGPL